MLANGLHWLGNASGYPDINSLLCQGRTGDLQAVAQPRERAERTSRSSGNVRFQFAEGKLTSDFLDICTVQIIRGFHYRDFVFAEPIQLVH